eukprot:scaffold1744_cov340-Prasinococcus_capsulatus_cf.AAC.17
MATTPVLQRGSKLPKADAPTTIAVHGRPEVQQLSRRGVRKQASEEAQRLSVAQVAAAVHVVL